MMKFILTLQFAALFLISCETNSGGTTAISAKSSTSTEGLLKELRASIDSGHYESSRYVAKLYSDMAGHEDLSSASKELLKEIDSLISEDKNKKAKVVEGLKKGMRVEVDDMRDVKFYYDKSSPEYSNRNSVHAYISESKKDIGLRFRIQYYAEDWLFIKTFMIKTDSIVTDIIPVSRLNTDNGGGMIWETWDEPIDLGKYELLLRIIDSKMAKVRFNGSQYYKEKQISSEQKRALKNVIELFKAMGGVVPKH